MRSIAGRRKAELSGQYCVLARRRRGHRHLEALRQRTVAGADRDRRDAPTEPLAGGRRRTGLLSVGAAVTVEHLPPLRRGENISAS